MAVRKPLVVINGQLQEIPAGDSLSAASSEEDVVAKTNGNAGAITIGMPVYLKADGTVDKASAAASGTKRVLGLVRDASIAAAANGNVQTDGVLTSADWTDVAGTATLTAGADYYLSATAGQLSASAPSSAGHYVCYVGMAISTDTLEIDTDRVGVLLA